MIKIEKIVTPSAEQWESIIMGARNPMNSWDRSDSGIGCNMGGDKKLCSKCAFKPNWCGERYKYQIGENDYELLLKLAKAGGPHAKYRRMIVVYMDITAPLYWYKQFETYHVGVVSNSCSTMHKIHDKEFTLDDFSCEHLIGFWETPLKETIEMLNKTRELYLEGSYNAKEYWYRMIQLLPSSYNQKRTVMLNYEVLSAMYRDRRNHKLDEWVEFCKVIETLPYSELITCN